MSNKKVNYTISVSDETARKIDEYKNFLNAKNKLRFTDLPYINEEDVIKGALDTLFLVIERFYEFDKESKFFNLKPKAKIKNRFREIAMKSGYDQATVSKLTGIDQPSVHRIMNNKNQPSIDYFIRIWIVLDRPPIEDIFYPDEQ